MTRSETIIPMDDVVLPFQIEGMDVRGRIVRMGPLVDTLLKCHDYPEPVANALGQALVLAALLGTSMKYDGIFTFQIKGNGPIGMLVADFATPGNLRAYASYDAHALDTVTKHGILPGYEVPVLFGTGHLALTVDQGPHTDRYQGIVALEGANLAESALQYFRVSEQIPTSLHLAVGSSYVAGAGGETRRAGGIMIQHLPKGREDRDRGITYQGADDTWQERWNTARILMESVQASELLDPNLQTEEVLYRLFHELGIRVFPALPLAQGCRCDRTRIEGILKSFGSAQLIDMVVDGQITVNCEFCNEVFAFDPREIDQPH